MGTIVYDGKDLSDFGVACIGSAVYGAPSRDVESVHIPGRNGDLLFDNGGFMNTDITYPQCSIVERFPVNVEGLRNHLLGKTGYRRLEDSYHPDEYRLAEYRGPFTADAHTARGYRSGTFDLTFNAMPQRFLKKGEKMLILAPQTYSNSQYRLVLNYPQDGDRLAITINVMTTPGATVTIGSNTYTADADGIATFQQNFNVSSKRQYIITSTAFIAALSGTNLGYDYEESTRYIILKNPAPYAQPVLQVVPGANATATVYWWSNGNQRTVVKETAGYADAIFTINSQTGTAVYQRQSGTVKYNGNLNVSGDLPIINGGTNRINADLASDAAAVYLVPNYWRV